MIIELLNVQGGVAAQHLVLPGGLPPAQARPCLAPEIRRAWAALGSTAASQLEHLEGQGLIPP